MKTQLLQLCLIAKTVLTFVSCDLNKLLDEACVADKDCSVAFSFCSEYGKCSCLPEFQENTSGHCKPKRLNCPSPSGGPRFEPYDGNWRACEVSYDPRNSQQDDSCSSNEFCFPHYGISTVDGKPVGHCCPRLANNDDAKVECPMSTVYNKTCPNELTEQQIRSGISQSAVRTCPYQTHSCFPIPPGIKKLCCPYPCRGAQNHIAVDGICYVVALPGDVCRFSAQCSGGAVCRPGQWPGESTCQCDGPISRQPFLHCADSPILQSHN